MSFTTELIGASSINRQFVCLSLQRILKISLFSSNIDGDRYCFDCQFSNILSYLVHKQTDKQTNRRSKQYLPPPMSEVTNKWMIRITLIRDNINASSNRAPH